MRTISALILIVLGAPLLYGQTEWTRQFAMAGAGGVLTGLALEGNSIYVCGTSLPTITGEVRRYDRTGNLSWARQFPTRLSAITATSASIFVAGTYQSSSVETRRLDIQGNEVWRRSIASVEFVQPTAIAADNSGIYVAGQSPGGLAGQPPGGNIAFLFKYDLNGTLLWVSQFGQSSSSVSISLTDSAVYIAGSTGGALPGQSWSGSLDAFVRKYDLNGTLIWTRQFGTSDYDTTRGIVSTSEGIRIVGYSVPLGGGVSSFLRAYDQNGNLQWARTFSNPELPSALASDGASLYSIGQVWEALPGQSAFGAADLALRQYDLGGNPGWVRQFGTSASDEGAALLADSSGIYLGGVSATANGTVALLARLDTGTLNTPLRFVPTAPCRVMDTRPLQGATGRFGPPIMEADETRSISIPQGRCNIPSTAKAYSLNVTAVPAGPLPFLTLWDGQLPRPLVSTLNSFHGGVVSNGAIVPAGFNGAIGVYAANRTDVILDINGYFTDSPQAMSFYTLPPCRVADTRVPSLGPLGTPGLVPGATRNFAINAGTCQIPNWATAYSLNTTVVPQTTLSYLTLWPTGNAQPLVSTLNSFDGSVVANAALVPAGSNGAISAYATDRTDLILDANGYFGPPGNLNELRFYPVAPCRITDTRTNNPSTPHPGAQTRDYPIAGNCGVPAGAKAYSLNVTVVPTGPLAYLTVWPSGTARPDISTLNAFTGRITANAAIVPAGLNDSVSIFVTADTHVILDVNGYFR